MLVRQMLSAGIPWTEMLARCSGGLTLLHRAVRSTHSDMVQLVVRLGEQHGTPFDWQVRGVCCVSRVAWGYHLLLSWHPVRRLVRFAAAHGQVHTPTPT